MTVDELMADIYAEERLKNAEALLAALLKADHHADVLNEIQAAHLVGMIAMARGVVANCRRELGL